MDVVKDRLSYCSEKLDKGDVNLHELINLMKYMVSLLDSANVFKEAKAEGEKVSLEEDMALELTEEATAQGEPQPTNIMGADEAKANAQGEQSSEQTPPTTKSTPPITSALIIHSAEENRLEDKPSEDEPLVKKLKFLIQTPLSSIAPQVFKQLAVENLSVENVTNSIFQTTSFDFSPTPPRDESKVNGIATKENLMKDLIREIKRLVDLKAEQEKSEMRLKKLSSEEIQAQAQKLAEYEAKRKRMLEEYNHCITFRANPLPITKISYKINRVTNDVTMRIERNNQPLNVTVHEKFVLRQLGFSEWIEIKTQAEKSGIPLPLELSAFGLSVAEKKRKRSSEIIKKVFVTEDIKVDGMKRNLIPPSRVIGSEGLVISEPESDIFFYNHNFGLVFQREEEFHLETTPQLTKIQDCIKTNSQIANEMFRKMILTIEARDDVVAVKDIIMEVKDYLKTYASAGMDISWYVEGIRWGLRTVRGGNTLTILLPFKEEQADLSFSFSWV
ncbi:hypothetical protein Tco_1079552 [Tanacetum coccineum]|uniref:Uncharacterized protein n=1 Tax=Tanacetum coccineum TaxID=301880 RepID=A0ABQ5HS57_9ASTR